MTKQVNIYYSVLQYIPSSIRGETLNVGIAFHIPKFQRSRFVSVRDKRRVAAFDDEWDKDFFDISMEALHEDIDWPTTGKLKKQTLNVDFPKNSLLEKDSSDYLYSKTNYLVNEFKFNNINTLVSNRNEVLEDMESLEKSYLYYDRPKNNRITTNEVKKLLQKSFKGKKAISKPKIEGDFGDKSIIDYKVDDYYVKVTSFDYAKNGIRSKELKSSLYDIQSALSHHDIKKIKVVVNDGYDIDQSQKNIFSVFQKRIDEMNKSFDSNIKVEKLSEVLEKS